MNDSGPSPKLPLKEIRILVCLTSVHPTQGGIATANRNLLRALLGMTSNGARFETAVLAYHGGVPELSDSYLQGRRFAQAEGCHSSRRRFVFKYLRLSFSWRPALVIVDHVQLAAVPYLFRWLWRAPYVLTCQGIEFNDHMSRLHKAAFRHATLRLATSHFTANRIGAMFPGVAIEPCPLGLDDLAMPDKECNDLISLRDVFGAPRQLGERAILIVGRLSATERYKGHDQLIAVMPGLLKQIPDAQLVVAGTGDDAERLQTLARESGAGQAIFFPGFVTPQQLSSLYSRSRLFAMPSRGEGFGLVYLEAMRFSKPCIASSADAGAEVVADGTTGIVVNPAVLEDLRKALSALLQDDALTSRLGKAGLERLDNQYRFHHYQARLQRKLQAVIPRMVCDDAEIQEESPSPNNRHPRARSISSLTTE
jgi:phosphatidyl-myo-inositol dimannoside synthase